MADYISKTKQLNFNTEKRLHFITITKDVEDFIKESKIDNGSLLIQTHHTTFGVWINEDENNLINTDIKKILDRFAHPDEEYHHNDVCDVRNPKGKRNTHLCKPNADGIIDECMNGHAHAQNLLISSSLPLIIENNSLVKGEWQEIMVVELDHDRDRKLTMLAQGVGK